MESFIVAKVLLSKLAGKKSIEIRFSYLIVSKVKHSVSFLPINFYYEILNVYIKVDNIMNIFVPII